MERELITEPKAEDPLLNIILNFGKDYLRTAKNYRIQERWMLL